RSPKFCASIFFFASHITRSISVLSVIPKLRVWDRRRQKHRLRPNCIRRCSSAASVLIPRPLSLGSSSSSPL
ncbi:hypothetical protein SDJN02_17528, partial [Cucurbita argyrosperma subsp. argyrosperma]